MDQWSNHRNEAGLECERIPKGADQIQAIASSDATVSLLDSQFAGERSFTEPSGRMVSFKACYTATCLFCNGPACPDNFSSDSSSVSQMRRIHAL